MKKERKCGWVGKKKKYLGRKRRKEGRHGEDERRMKA